MLRLVSQYLLLLAQVLVNRWWTTIAASTGDKGYIGAGLLFKRLLGRGPARLHHLQPAWVCCIWYACCDTRAHLALVVGLLYLIGVP